MGSSLTVMVVSGLVALLLVVLFRIERRRSVRYGARVRTIFDRVLSHLNARIFEPSVRATGRAFRQTMHYLFHRFLTTFLHFIHRLEEVVREVVRVNRDRANRPQQPEARSHLRAMNEYKRSAQLTDEEKRERREAALLGR